jgi:hypothetical protein
MRSRPLLAHGLPYVRSLTFLISMQVNFAWIGRRRRTFAAVNAWGEDGGMTADDEVAAEQISALEAKRYQAMTDADIATLEDLFSANLVYTHSDASSDSKQSYLERLASGHFDYCPVDHPEDSIVVHGDCALVFGDMRGEVQIAGQKRVLNSRSLAVWVRENERWVLLAYQPTKYPA